LLFPPKFCNSFDVAFFFIHLAQFLVKDKNIGAAPLKNNIRTLTISHATISGRLGLINLDNVSVQPEITRSTFSFFCQVSSETEKKVC